MYGKTILGFALLLRLCVVAMVVGCYPRDWLFSKAPDLGFLAASLAAGRGLCSPFGGSTGPTAFLAPGYPALLGLIFYLSGSYSRGSALVVMALQTLFAVGTVAVMMHLARRMFGAPVANLAGTFWALSPPLLWLPAVLWETSLSTLLLTGMAALTMSCAGQPGRKLWLGMGAYCGLAMLINPALMPALLALLGWTAWQTRSAKRLWPCLLLQHWPSPLGPYAIGTCCMPGSPYVAISDTNCGREIIPGRVACSMPDSSRSRIHTSLPPTLDWAK